MYIPLKHESYDIIAKPKINRKTNTCDFQKNLTSDYKNNLFTKNIPTFSFTKPNVKYTKSSKNFI